ncbi:MAG: 2-phosphosulfolactate phosphatase [Dehalococcoidia bacterium]
MRLDVALAPSQIRDTEQICAVVDTLRASSTIVTLLERGVPEILPAASIDDARTMRERLPDHLLCGEAGGLPPPGFDYGNSPAEFTSAELAGRSVILATSNGTRVLASLSSSPAVVVGAPLNREAVAAALLALGAEHSRDACVVCAAAPSGALALEDALGAGAIVEAALRLDPSLQPTDAARFARQAFRACRDDLPAALASGRHGVELVDAGFGADVAFCARLDVSAVVPRLGRTDGGLLTLRP